MTVATFRRLDYALLLARKVENLPRENQIGITDLVLIGLIDHSIFHPFTIDTPGNTPQAVPRLDNST